MTNVIKSSYDHQTLKGSWSRKHKMHFIHAPGWFYSIPIKFDDDWWFFIACLFHDKKKRKHTHVNLCLESLSLKSMSRYAVHSVNFILVFLSLSLNKAIAFTTWKVLQNLYWPFLKFSKWNERGLEGLWEGRKKVKGTRREQERKSMKGHKILKIKGKKCLSILKLNFKLWLI